MLCTPGLHDGRCAAAQTREGDGTCTRDQRDVTSHSGHRERRTRAESDAEATVKEVETDSTLPVVGVSPLGGLTPMACRDSQAQGCEGRLRPHDYGK